MSAVSTGHIPSAMAASLRRIASLASRCPKLASAWLQSKSAEPRQEVEGRADSPITAAGAEAEAEGRAAPATAEAEVEGRADSPTAAEAEEEGRAALPTGAEAGVACAAPAAASAEEASSSAEMEVSATSAASISSTGGSASCDGGGGGGGEKRVILIINASKKKALIGNEHLFPENEPENANLTPDICREEGSHNENGNAAEPR